MYFKNSIAVVVGYSMISKKVEIFIKLRVHIGIEIFLNYRNSLNFYNT